MNWLDKMEAADPAYHSYPDLEPEEFCHPGGDLWFDRALCACDAMHTRCAGCGRALDGCPYDPPVL